MAGVRVVHRSDARRSQLPAGTCGELNALIKREHVVMIVDPAEVSVNLLRQIRVNTQHIVAAGVGGAGRFKEIHYVRLVAGAREIRQREEIEHGGAKTRRVRARSRNSVAGERRTRLGVVDHQQRSVIGKALREIPAALQRCGRVLRLRAAADELTGVFLRPEEEQLLPLSVK